MRSNRSNSGDESHDDLEMGGPGEPRVRDRHKKMRVPFFGLVYKRQMGVNLICAVLLAAYITLICLV